jgi:hypothetical protein
VIREHAKDPAIGDALFVPAMLADLAGQLMVHAYEVPHGRESRQLSLGQGQDPTAFLAHGWQEALDYFRDRGLVTPKELSRLLRDRALESEAARDLLLKRVQERVYELLGDAIGEGSSYQEFAQQLEGSAEGLGITAQDPGYLSNVFRTNVLDAYGAGRARALSHPDVVAARPYRQTHAAADGLVYRADGPLAGLRPPFSWQCRCAVTSLSSWDGDVIESVPAGLLGDGFGGV